MTAAVAVTVLALLVLATFAIVDLIAAGRRLIARPTHTVDPVVTAERIATVLARRHDDGPTP